MIPAQFKTRIRDSVPCMYWSITLILASVCAGIASMVAMPSIADELVKSLQTFAADVLDRPAWQLFLFIFFNNTVKALFVLLFSVLFAVAPVLFLIVNGYIIGLVVSMVAIRDGAFVLLAGIVPHGIFELPAVILVSALGLLLGVRFIERVRGTFRKSIVQELIATGRLFVVFIVPLFLLAALVEVFVTPAFLALVS